MAALSILEQGGVDNYKHIQIKQTNSCWIKSESDGAAGSGVDITPTSIQPEL